jgi:hypothetical protein
VQEVGRISSREKRLKKENLKKDLSISEVLHTETCFQHPVENGRERERACRTHASDESYISIGTALAIGPSGLRKGNNRPSLIFITATA